MITDSKHRSLPPAWYWLAIIAFGLIAEPILATSDSDLKIRQIYTNENAPPEIRFKLFLTNIGLADQGDDRFTILQMQAMGFTPNDIPSVLTYLKFLYDEVEAEIARSMWRIACHDNAANLGGSEIRSVYNSLADLRQAVFAKYLAIATAELAGMGYPDFMYMISAYPGPGMSFKSVSTDHRFAWGPTDEGIQQNRERLCRNLKDQVL